MKKRLGYVCGLAFIITFLCVGCGEASSAIEVTETQKLEENNSNITVEADTVKVEEKTTEAAEEKNDEEETKSDETENEEVVDTNKYLTREIKIFGANIDTWDKETLYSTALSYKNNHESGWNINYVSNDNGYVHILDGYGNSIEVFELSPELVSYNINLQPGNDDIQLAFRNIIEISDDILTEEGFFTYYATYASDGRPSGTSTWPRDVSPYFARWYGGMGSICFGIDITKTDNVKQQAVEDNTKLMKMLDSDIYAKLSGVSLVGKSAIEIALLVDKDFVLPKYNNNDSKYVETIIEDGIKQMSSTYYETMLNSEKYSMTFNCTVKQNDPLDDNDDEIVGCDLYISSGNVFIQVMSDINSKETVSLMINIANVQKQVAVDIPEEVKEWAEYIANNDYDDIDKSKNSEFILHNGYNYSLTAERGEQLPNGQYSGGISIMITKGY